MTRRDVLVHGGLYVAACITTTLAGGPAFAATLMAILTCHEFGHYIVARRHGVDVSLPYFIPMPPGLTLGTLGAVIQMRKPIDDRRALFDVGAAGPIAGLVVTIPLLVIGLSLSTVNPQHADGMIEGNSILYALLKLAVFHKWLPGGGEDVDLHPMALGAWVGLLVTTINLMPIGQLDGGHVARSALGDRHEVWSQRLHVALPLVGFAVGGVMFASALDAGDDWVDALSYAKYGVMPWCVWSLMIAWMRHRGGEYHPPVSDVPLDAARRWRAIGVLVIFCLIATPVPFRPVL
jgi:membrane-associated protease RseP (regulator of RpoE activity)|nr:site-2 protease family protein [Kofleriaceae bacterium]